MNPLPVAERPFAPQRPHSDAALSRVFPLVGSCLAWVTLFGLSLFAQLGCSPASSDEVPFQEPGSRASPLSSQPLRAPFTARSPAIGPPQRSLRGLAGSREYGFAITTAGRLARFEPFSDSPGLLAANEIPGAHSVISATPRWATAGGITYLQATEDGQKRLWQQASPGQAPLFLGPAPPNSTALLWSAQEMLLASHGLEGGMVFGRPYAFASLLKQEVKSAVFAFGPASFPAASHKRVPGVWLFSAELPTWKFWHFLPTAVGELRPSHPWHPLSDECAAQGLLLRGEPAILYISGAELVLQAGKAGELARSFDPRLQGECLADAIAISQTRAVALTAPSGLLLDIPIASGAPHKLINPGVSLPVLPGPERRLAYSFDSSSVWVALDEVGWQIPVGHFGMRWQDRVQRFSDVAQLFLWRDRAAQVGYLDEPLKPSPLPSAKSTLKVVSEP